MTTNHYSDRELLLTYARTVAAFIDSEPSTLDDDAFERAQIAGLHAVLARYCPSNAQTYEAFTPSCPTLSPTFS